MNKIVDNISSRVQKNLFYIGLVFIIIYFSPLFMEPLYISIFDILDSTVPQLKILAHSSMMFAPNSTIIPNMMNGLPRSTYGSEFDIYLWLNYFFSPQTAYIINQILIHLVAYTSAYIFLKRYIVKEKDITSSMILLAGSLYYGLIPFFSPEGLSLPLLPLVTYSLLNIKNHQSTKWDWVLLAVMPLYTSFVFIYVFYITLAGLYLAYDSIKNRHINMHFFAAIVLMGITFLLKEYRLLISTFISPEFISHRVEFHKFFVNDLLESLRRGHAFFLNGHAQHLVDLQMPYLIPVVLIAMFLSLSKRKFSHFESMVLWLIIVISYATDFWSETLAQIYTLPILIAYTLIIWLLTKYNRIFPLLFLLQLLLALFTMFSFCECGHVLAEIFPFLKMFNISRLAFIQPLLWLVLLVYGFRIYADRLQYTTWFVILFISVQSFHQFSVKEFYNTKKLNYATFDQYYAPTVFTKIKHSTPQKLTQYRVVSYGLEPAISLYNGFYTVDGYITNYPLSYKYKFRKVIAKYLQTITKHNNYDEWGSKVYLLGAISLPDYYQKDVVLKRLPFSVNALCALHTDYLFSAFQIDRKILKDLSFVETFKGEKDSWDIYLYKINCKKPEEKLDQ